MHINITAGECLKELLENLHKEEVFIPFNEAMNSGSYTSPLFSEEFLQERASHHKVSLQEYKDKLNSFIQLLNVLDCYDQIFLYFGDEPFCRANRTVVIETLKQHGFKGRIILYIVDENTGEILAKEGV